MPKLPTWGKRSWKPKTYRKRRMKAVPASAAGRGPFEVTETPPDQSPGSVYPLYNSNATKVGKFMAPGGSDPTSQALRAHEYGHLLLSRKGIAPKNPQTIKRWNPGLDDLNLQFLMDAYVNRFLKTKGVDEVNDLPIGLENMDMEQLKELPPHIIAGEVLRHYDYNDVRKLTSHTKYLKDYEPLEKVQKWEPTLKRYVTVNELDKYRQDQLKRSREEKRRLEKLPSTRSWKIAKEYLTHEQQQFIQRFHAQHILALEKRYGPSFASMAAEWQNVFGPWPPGEAPWEIQEKEMQLSPEERKMFEQFSQHYPQGTTPPPVDDPGYWGEMGLIENTPKPRRIKEALKALQPKPGFVGAFRFPHRADLRFGDGRAFAHKLRRLGGTILLDCSGSMSLSAEEINELMENAPAGKIACYAETGHLPSELREQAEASNPHFRYPDNNGITIIAAHKGKAMDHRLLRDTLGCNNLVDGMALRWLAQQDGPRIWVSDGGVTGTYGHGEPLLTDAFNVVRRGKIKHVGTIEDCISLVRRLNGK